MIPTKLQKGQKFKPATVDKINEIIDYLKTQRVVGDNRTIRVNQGASGLLISATPPTPSKGGGKSVQLNHPFKLSFIQDEQSKKSLLRMQSGIIQFMGDVGKVVFCGYKIVQEGSTDEYKAPLPLPTAVGNYGIVLHLFYNTETTQNIHNISFDYRLCYYKDKQISDAINSSGIYSVPIGTIKVEKKQKTEPEAEDEFIYSILKQNVTSHISVYDQLDVPFKAWFKMNTYPEDGTILESLYPDTIVVNSGSVACNRQVINYDKEEVQFKQGIHWLRVNTMLKTAELTTETLEPNYTVDQIVYAFPLFEVYKDGQSTANIIQGFQGNITMSYDGRVQLDREDNTVNFLNNKLKYPLKKKEELTEDEKAIYAKGKEYIIGIKENASLNPDIKDNMDNLFWDWTKISGYDKEKYLQLNSNKSNLQFESAYLTLVTENDVQPDYLEKKIVVSNTLFKKIQNQSIYKIIGMNTKGGKNIKVEDKQKNTETQYKQINGYKTIVKKGDGIDVEEKAENDGFNLTYTIKIDPVYLVNLFTSQDKSVEITLNTTTATPTIDLSAVKVSVNSSDTNPDYLENKEFSEDNSIVFSVVGNKLSEKINPDYFTSNDKTVKFTKGNGYLDLSASGKIKVTDTDPTSGNLSDKIISDNDSLLFSVTQVQELNIKINDGYFISTDDSVQFDSTDPNHLDIKASGGGKVKVTQDDSQAGYLQEKLDTANDSIKFTFVPDTAFIDLNPAFFTSSDESIEIIDNETSLDFKCVGSDKVKVNKDDTEAGYLQEKIFSENQSITITVKNNSLNLELNKTYFTSTDGSIEITDNDTSLDFKSNGKVKVTQEDTAGYLQEKLDTTNDSLKFTFTPDTAFIDINAAYFTSSDDSIEITDNDTSLDFKSNGKVKVTQEDQAGYLQEKLDSTNDSIKFTFTPDTAFIDINAAYFTSSDGSIEITDNDTSLDLKSNGMVKCSESDQAGYLNSKIQVDSSIASLITLDKQADKIVIKSAIQGSGIMLVNNGAVSLLEASGNAVLVCQGGVIKWNTFKECENACNEE